MIIETDASWAKLDVKRYGRDNMAMTVPHIVWCLIDEQSTAW